MKQRLKIRDLLIGYSWRRDYLQKRRMQPWSDPMKNFREKKGRVKKSKSGGREEWLIPCERYGQKPHLTKEERITKVTHSRTTETATPNSADRSDTGVPLTLSAAVSRGPLLLPSTEIKFLRLERGTKHEVKNKASKRRTTKLILGLDKRTKTRRASAKNKVTGYQIDLFDGSWFTDRDYNENRYFIGYGVAIQHYYKS
ncbi:hypothetical protein Ccrd_005950 [Cynara cardunculus var. scolymus]|uniref:Uncharacterized protein n=1 Tax=Cynara cardunculus var. scolymus TaxID=59895 RepID=A0A103XK14_CYNCS|nr:hypothetical protein Ccrd_005950 [Cynara cardunculus var. scolymus]